MGNLQSGPAFMLGAEARYAFAPVTINKLTSALSLGARYAYMPVSLPTFAGTERFGVQAIDGVLAWSFNDALRGPFEHLERTLPIEMAVPVGVVIGPAGRAAFAGGLEIRFLLPL
jgi:hypothetical protein